MKIRIDVDTSKAEYKVYSIRRNSVRRMQNVIRRLLKEGFDYARMNVYIDTGQTRDAIRVFMELTPTGAVGTIFMYPYIRRDEYVRNRNVTPFSLVKWSHTSPLAQGHFKTGDPQFMFSTRRYINQRAPGLIAEEFKQR